jgi:capsular polysaccharide biosynthesis protein
MSTECYRIRDINAPSLPSLREREGAKFLSAKRFEGQLCHDMYGDLPYGLFELPQATVRGEAGYIFQNGDPILEQNADFLRHKKFLRPRFENLPQSTENAPRIAALLSLTSRRHNCFWHWMMDSLPKVYLAEESGFRGMYLVPSPDIAPWARESLAIVEIPNDRVLTSTGGDIQAERLYIPTYFCGYNAHHNLPFARLFREWIRSHILKEAPVSRSRIFVGRQPTAPQRKVLNQNDLASVANAFGFTMVFFEDFSLREQLALSCSSEAILGGHGSGLTHALFMDEGSLLIELFPYQRRQTNDCYEKLSNIANLRYNAIETESDQGSDIEVSTEVLRALLMRSMNYARKV